MLPAADYYPSATSQPGDADLDLAGNLDRADQVLFRLDFKGTTRWYSRAMDQNSTRLEPWIGMIWTLT